MRGAIAAGSKVTAEAGAEVLEAGGNAVDAAVAACFATAVGEPVLTSLAGGGAMLVRDGASGRTTVCDFFANAPGLGGHPPDHLDFFPAELDFGSATQYFHIGRAAAAVPGVIPGLCTALQRWGSLPLRAVIRPACRLAREGAPLDKLQAHTFQVLKPILLHTPEGREQFSRGGELLAQGDRYSIPQLANLLEGMATEGWQAVYDREVGEPALRQFGVESGGLLTAQDWHSYRPEYRRPLSARYRDAVLFTNPPPAAGGALIALMLRLLEEEDPRKTCTGESTRVAALCRAMTVADESRRDGEEYPLREDGTVSERWLDRYRELSRLPLDAVVQEDAGPGNTTHVSVVDAAGNAASVTFSYGEGNGHLIGDSGIMMNNLMGEEDLFPHGFHRWPAGERLSTMMSPAVLEHPNGDLVVLGSGGANRIRTAITQVISRLLDCGEPLLEAVHHPRIHFEHGVLSAETFGWSEGAAFLAGMGAPEYVPFPAPNLFFGGVHLVRRCADGTLQGVGDPRRGGACVVV